MKIHELVFYDFINFKFVDFELLYVYIEKARKPS